MSSRIRVAIADDHTLFRKSLALLLEDDMYYVPIQAENGQDLIDRLQMNSDIDIVLMDINMPVLNGFKATDWVVKNTPHIQVLALTMSDEDSDVIRMLRSGAKGYILKDVEPLELKRAIRVALEKGFYASEITGKVMTHILNDPDHANIEKIISALLPSEIEYIKLACSDMNHKQMADFMGVSPRTIDNYRDQVYHKLKIQSRIPLVIFAIKHRIYSIS